ncbi:MAG: zf-HC2 domain-containing protein [Ignavibacteriales bacterium]|nr:zf-HC2 domain-containing protein [Ignavibacteriales bacterium]
MRTEHPNIRLIDFAAGRLDAEDRERLERHLAECPECRDDLRSIEIGVDALRQPSHETIPRVYFTTILPRVRSRIAEGKPKPVLGWIVWSKLAFPFASLALIIGILFLSLGEEENGLERNPLRPVLQSVRADEAIDVLIDEAMKSSMMRPLDQVAAESVLNDRAQVKILHKALKEQPSALGGANDFSSSTLEYELSDLSNDQVNELLERLSEREIQ